MPCCNKVVQQLDFSLFVFLFHFRQKTYWFTTKKRPTFASKVAHLRPVNDRLMIWNQYAWFCLQLFFNLYSFCVYVNHNPRFSFQFLDLVKIYSTFWCRQIWFDLSWLTMSMFLNLYIVLICWLCNDLKISLL